MNNGTFTALIPYVPATLRRQEVGERIVPPVTDIYETNDAFVVKLDLPGATKEGIRLHIEPRKLVVQSSIATTEGTSLVYGEIGRKRYYREFNLGDGIANDAVTATFEDGVLTVTLPKSEELKAREIQIR